ncbi:MAG: hypothetical protein DYH20_15915, partial [Gammaproteobacteria bacterium PRO9]|nr:hypothetical protein [Gammaproteobacteria bacterium PRO9]
EMRDVLPTLNDILYQFLGRRSWLDEAEIRHAIQASGPRDTEIERAFDLLLWYGVIGVVRESTDVAYIYSVKYDMKRLKAIAAGALGGKAVYEINPAFWAGLEIQA